MADDFKKYDSQADFEMRNARLAKDPQVTDGEKGQIVRLTTVCTSRADADSDLWVEATVADRQADLAAFLKKGDTLGIAGFPCLRRWGDDNEKFSFNLRRAEIFPSIELFKELKERGFEPGANKAAAKTAAKTTTKKPAKAKKPIVELDDDDDLPPEKTY